MRLLYTQHLKNRLKERKFPHNYPKKIFLEAEENYRDDAQNSFIAIKRLPYAGKIRKLMIAYTFEGVDVKILTIHHESDSEIKNRIKNGRWVKL